MWEWLQPLAEVLTQRKRVENESRCPLILNRKAISVIPSFPLSNLRVTTRAPGGEKGRNPNGLCH